VARAYRLAGAKMLAIKGPPAFAAVASKGKPKAS
jgi:hypothetical protein